MQTAGLFSSHPGELSVKVDKKSKQQLENRCWNSVHTRISFYVCVDMSAERQNEKQFVIKHYLNFILLWKCWWYPFSILNMLDGQQECHPACKNAFTNLKSYFWETQPNLTLWWTGRTTQTLRMRVKLGKCLLTTKIYHDHHQRTHMHTCTYTSLDNKCIQTHSSSCCYIRKGIEVGG